MTEPRWIAKTAVLVLHDRSLSLHGGAAGMRDEGLLDSALERPRNHFFYEQISDLAVLAATYAVGVAGNHPFVDGNKRAAFLCCTLFLRRNDLKLTATQADAARTMFEVAAGQLRIEALAAWLRERTKPTA
jgi:death-on-curing protein